MADDKGAAADKKSGPPNEIWPIKDKEGFYTVPFAYGSIAFWQGKRAQEFQTHKWHIYVRGANNEDLSPLIERVIFQLHPSFNNPTRVIDTAPFHVTELGCGEFEISIKIFFHEGPEQGVELKHMLALFPKQGEPTMKKPVVSEKYDELVFNAPSEALLQRIQLCNSRLTNVGPPAGPAWAQIEPFFAPCNEHDELLRMQAAQRRVQAEAELLKEEFEAEDSAHALLTDEVRRLEAGPGQKKS